MLKKSIPNIKYQLADADEYLAETTCLIEEETAEYKKGKGTPPKPVKKMRMSSYKSKTYLESEEDVEQFLTKVAVELKKAINSNHRVMVQ